jgi:hypothetical protein
VETVALKQKLSVLVGTALLAASLTACNSGGETDDGNSGQSTPTAVPTADDTSDSGVQGDDNDSNQGPDGSGG